jgi:hypothetical protein
MVGRAGLEHIRELVASRKCKLTGHADELSQEEGWRVRDVAACIATGRLRKRERDDSPCHGSDGWKYTIEGKACCGSPFYVVVKRVNPPGGSWFVRVVTAHIGRRRHG